MLVLIFQQPDSESDNQTAKKAALSDDALDAPLNKNGSEQEQDIDGHTLCDAINISKGQTSDGEADSDDDIDGKPISDDDSDIDGKPLEEGNDEQDEDMDDLDGRPMPDEERVWLYGESVDEVNKGDSSGQPKGSKDEEPEDDMFST